MQSPENKVDMAQVKAAIDKVLAIPARKPEKLKRTQRDTERPPPAKSSKNDPRPAVR